MNRPRILLNRLETGHGQPAVLLHGMVGSARYWQPLTARLANKFHVIAFDLLGFGDSPKPRSSNYSLDEHIESILNSLDAAGITQPVILIGHSIGALIALALAARHPQRVKRLILLSLPVYRSRTEARAHILAASRLPEHLLYGPLSRLACWTFCQRLRPLTKQIVPFYLKRLPRVVAQDSLLHTWHSYFGTLTHVLENQDVAAELKYIKVPIQLLYGTEDKLLAPTNIESLAAHSRNIRITKLPGNHHLAIDSPDIVARAIAG